MQIFKQRHQGESAFTDAAASPNGAVMIATMLKVIPPTQLAAAFQHQSWGPALRSRLEMAALSALWRNADSKETLAIVKLLKTDYGADRFAIENLMTPESWGGNGVRAREKRLGILHHDNEEYFSSQDDAHLAYSRNATPRPTATRTQTATTAATGATTATETTRSTSARPQVLRTAATKQYKHTDLETNRGIDALFAHWDVDQFRAWAALQPNRLLAPTGSQKRTPLGHVVASGNTGAVMDIIAMLDVESRALGGQTAFIDMLDKRDPNGYTALMLATDANNICILDLLLSKGANPVSKRPPKPYEVQEDEALRAWDEDYKR
ncbi:MAG: ankyrin repeat domain-containing protein, partial [Oxalobacteraceae bacterium]